MTKFRLDIEYDYDFLVTGISCHEKPYRLCWAINRALGLEMNLTDPLTIALKKNEAPATFPLFIQENLENDTTVILVSNRTRSDDAGLLIPEHHQADYFFIAKGPFNDNDHRDMLAGIKEIPFVLMSYRIDPSLLKSKQNLLF